MKGTVIHYQNTRNSTIFSAKIAVYVSGLLEFTLYDRANKHPQGKQDVVIVVNSSTLFCDWAQAARKLIESAKTIIVCRHDETIPIDAYIRAKKPVYLSSVKDELCDHQIVWEKLGYYDYKPQTPKDVIYPGLGYYGSFKERRQPLLEKYFNTTQYPVTIATTPRNRKRFETVCPGAKIIGPVTTMETLKQFQSLMFIQDINKTMKITSRFYEVSRFYEAIGAGIPQLFDEKSVDNVEAHGLDAEKYRVSNPDDVSRMLSNIDRIRKEQSKWRKDYRAELRKDATVLFEKHGIPCE